MMTQSSIQPIQAFDDNYIWLITQRNHACVVDPGDGHAVIKHLQSQQLILTHVLITHWHPDHIGGLKALKAEYPNIEIFAPESEHIPIFTQHVHQGSRVDIFDLSFTVIEVPGHTMEHIVYSDEQHDVLFAGDTLFSGGCGRVFEGTFEQMFVSLNKLKALPSSTLIYCAHEYTLANLEFCQAVENKNTAISDRIKVVKTLRHDGTPSIPCLLEDELNTNVFLRLSANIQRNMPDNLQIDAEIKDKLASKTPLSELDVFTALRQWKNNF